MGKATITSHIDDGLYDAETKWRNTVGDENKELWCADYSVSPYPELTGDVGTIEVPNEPKEQMIRPGYDGRAAYDASRDGILVKPLQMSPSEFFYNLAMLPGWQKWMPTYRFAKILKPTWQNYLDNELPVELLDPNLSTQQNIGVTPPTPYVTPVLVTVEYLECDAAAFEVDDIVVIEYSPVLGGGFPARSAIQYTPKIIGFKSNPRPDRFLVKLQREDGEYLKWELGAYYGITADAKFGAWGMGGSAIWIESYKYLEENLEYMDEKIDDGVGVWAIKFFDEYEEYNPDGYFVKIRDWDYSILTQYPGRRYTAASRAEGLDGDTMQPGAYAISSIPYWEQVTTQQQIVSHSSRQWDSFYPPCEVVDRADNFEGTGGTDDTSWTGISSIASYAINAQFNIDNPGYSSLLERTIFATVPYDLNISMERRYEASATDMTGFKSDWRVVDTEVEIDVCEGTLSEGYRRRNLADNDHDFMRVWDSEVTINATFRGTEEKYTNQYSGVIEKPKTFNPHETKDSESHNIKSKHLKETVWSAGYATGAFLNFYFCVDPLLSVDLTPRQEAIEPTPKHPSEE